MQHVLIILLTSQWLGVIYALNKCLFYFLSINSKQKLIIALNKLLIIKI